MPGTEKPVSEPASKEATNYVVESKDVFDSSVFDPVLAKKLALINTAIDKIGMTPFQWKLFFLNGFGYTVDSVRALYLWLDKKTTANNFFQLLVICQSIAMPAVTMQYGSPDKSLKGIALASQIGLLVGAAIWGLSADIIGRRLAFNSSLLLAAIFTIIAGGMPGYISFATLLVLPFFMRRNGLLMLLIGLLSTPRPLAGITSWTRLLSWNFCPRINPGSSPSCPFGGQWDILLPACLHGHL